MHIRRILAVLLAISLLAAGNVYAEETIPQPPAPTMQAEYDMPYEVAVDIANQIVTVYNADDGGIVRQMICSTGYGTLTPTGTYIMPEKKYEAERGEWYWFGEYEVYAKYASRIVNGILFHSILYVDTHSAPTWTSTNALGYKASHGCVRLWPEDAQWIAENCMPGTRVTITDDNEINEDLRELLLHSTFSADHTGYDEFLKGYIPLKKGSTYSKVRTVQETLNNLGFDCGEADGIFGSATVKGVKAWQQAMGVQADGVISPQQLEAILTGTTPPPTPVPTPTPTPRPTPVPTPTPDISAMEGTIALVKVQEGSTLNLRAMPDVQSEIIARLTSGMAVKVVEEGYAWCKVEYAGKTGWTGSNYINIVKRDDAQ